MNVVVTGGGTIAPIDDVRLMTNVSSGHFAASITEAWLDRGDTVWHIQTPTALVPMHRFAILDLNAPEPAVELERLARLRKQFDRVRGRLHLEVLPTGTVGEYREALKRILTGQAIDVAVLAMAVSDFEPEPFVGKISSDAESLTVHCRRAPKVIRMVRDWSPSTYLAGFKLLSRASVDELIHHAENACTSNRADLTVANDLQTLRDGRHTVHLVRSGFEPMTLEPGEDLAHRLVDQIAAWASVQPVGTNSLAASSNGSPV